MALGVRRSKHALPCAQPPAPMNISSTDDIIEKKNRCVQNLASLTKNKATPFVAGDTFMLNAGRNFTYRPFYPTKPFYAPPPPPPPHTHTTAFETNHTVVKIHQSYQMATLWVKYWNKCPQQISVFTGTCEQE